MKPQGGNAAAGPWAVFLLALGADSSKPSFVNLTSGQVYINLSLSSLGWQLHKLQQTLKTTTFPLRLALQL